MIDELPQNTNIAESKGESLVDKTVTQPSHEDIPKEESAGDINEYRKELKSIKEEAVKTKKTIERIENITYLGFIIIILMVAGLVFGYWQFIYTESKNNYYNNTEEQIKISNNIKELQTLKNCLENGGWNSCLK